jgi:hypothetical protein
MPGRQQGPNHAPVQVRPVFKNHSYYAPTQRSEFARGSSSVQGTRETSKCVQDMQAGSECYQLGSPCGNSTVS